jgi:hypothetical protein
LDPYAGIAFWMMKGPQGDAKGPDAPSWSRASRNGSKFFWKTIVQFRLGIDQENLIQNGIQVYEAGTITIIARYTDSLHHRPLLFLPYLANLVL